MLLATRSQVPYAEEKQMCMTKADVLFTEDVQNAITILLKYRGNTCVAKYNPYLFPC